MSLKFYENVLDFRGASLFFALCFSPLHVCYFQHKLDASCYFSHVVLSETTNWIMQCAKLNPSLTCYQFYSNTSLENITFSLWFFSQMKSFFYLSQTFFFFHNHVLSPGLKDNLVRSLKKHSIQQFIPFVFQNKSTNMLTHSFF